MTNFVRLIATLTQNINILFILPHTELTKYYSFCKFQQRTTEGLRKVCRKTSIILRILYSFKKNTCRYKKVV